MYTKSTPSPVTNNITIEANNIKHPLGLSVSYNFAKTQFTSIWPDGFAFIYDK